MNLHLGKTAVLVAIEIVESEQTNVYFMGKSPKREIALTFMTKLMKEIP